MFDFLFKRSRKPSTPVEPDVRAEQVREQEQQRRQSQVADKRQQALQQLEQVAGDEEALVAFIVSCELADVRLQAAERLQSAAALQRVQQALRNSDRRVFKLTQSRLRQLQEQAERVQHIQQCLEQARQLLALPALALNKVAQLDHDWQALGAVEPAAQQEFAQLRAALGERLRAQADLQRALNQALTEVRLMADAAGQEPADQMRPRLEQLASEVAVCSAAPEAHVLSRAQLAEFAERYAALHKQLDARQRQQAAQQEREGLLLAWETAALDSLQPAELKRQWQALPALPEPLLAPLQARFASLLQNVQRARHPLAPPPEAEPATAPLDAGATRRAFDSALQALEQALDDGLLQAAAMHDRQLRQLDLQLIHPAQEQLQQLAQLRSELTRLRDWARWGGNVSREELIRAVEELPQQELPVTELARRVGSSRERWKSLDQASGPASKAQWERFDAACSQAWAPVAAHYQQLAEQRAANLAQAQGLLDDVRLYAATLNASAEPDWKGALQFVRDMRQAWRRLGVMDRREKKRLDGELDAVIDQLLQPLHTAREEEVARREGLIAQVAALDPRDRASVERLRELQARWQEQARRLPLERRQEQDLWQRFRAACDQVFAARKALAEAADSERQAHLATCTAICERLEALTGSDSQALSSALRDAERDWQAAGPLPRAAEAAVRQRYEQACQRLQQQLQNLLQAREQARSQSLRQALELCLAAESALGQPGSGTAVAALQRRWQELTPRAGELGRVLDARFAAAVAAGETADAAYVQALQDNQPRAARELLRLEIMAGVDSPAELAGERLKLQVEVLQDSLKSGQRPAARQEQLQHLCAIPARLSAAEQQRLLHVLTQL